MRLYALHNPLIRRALTDPHLPFLNVTHSRTQRMPHSDHYEQPRYNASTPAYGGATPAYGGATPAHGGGTAYGGATPRHGGATPSHDGERLPALCCNSQLLSHMTC